MKDVVYICSYNKNLTGELFPFLQQVPVDIIIPAVLILNIVYISVFDQMISVETLSSAGEMLTNEFLNRIWVFESLSHSVVQFQKSQHEEQSQTQLQGEGQHAQHDYGVVNC